MVRVVPVDQERVPHKAGVKAWEWECKSEVEGALERLAVRARNRFQDRLEAGTDCVYVTRARDDIRVCINNLYICVCTFKFVQPYYGWGTQFWSERGGQVDLA